MGKDYYISSCVFTSRFPELSRRIRDIMRERYSLTVVRCCVQNYKVHEFEERMPTEASQREWREIPHSADFGEGDRVYSLCHNCNNIIDEMNPDVGTFSLWELIDSDTSFPYPDHSGMSVTLQDCWRSRDRANEQDAVRRILDKMGIVWVEAAESRENTRFCGVSLLRPQPPRNPKLAPRHYAEGIEGLFIEHTADEQKSIMEDYCSNFKTHAVVCYCHYCLEGLLLGGVDGVHLAELIFQP